MNLNRLTIFPRLIISGICLSVFLLGANPVFASEQINTTSQALETGSLEIIFATHANVAEFSGEVSNIKFLFGNDKLTPTYTGVIQSSDFSLLEKDSRIEYVQLDNIVATQVIPSDPFFSTNSIDKDKQWYLHKIKMAKAWEFGTGSKNVRVAIIDTGIHANHVELDDGRVKAGYDAITQQPIKAGADSDDNGHGTAVAGVIGAMSDNDRGIAGINWDVSLVPVKALEADGTGRISHIAAGIVWAAENKIDIINLSVGGPGFGADQTLYNAIAYAYHNNVLIVAAAGNDLAKYGINLDQKPVYPICADGENNMVIGVAASDNNDEKATFSNFGINCVDITAPGKNILTTAYLPSDPSDRLLIYGSGTSMATPMVSGVAALLKANNPGMTNVQMREILLQTADNIDSINKTQCLDSSCAGFLGQGRLNALLALSPQPLLDGSLVRQASSGSVYLIEGGRKRYVSDFVFEQNKYDPASVISERDGQLREYRITDPVLPKEGTLLKSADDPTVYVINNQLKRPLTYLVFKSREYSFANVKTIPSDELEDIKTGEWYWPPDGTMVLLKDSPTVYVMDDGVKRAVTYFVFIERKLSFSKVISVTTDEFGHIPNAPDKYWLPPRDGTLIKSDTSDAVYLIENGMLKALSAEAFSARKLKFSDVKTLPQAEVDVIKPGSPITN